jgi:hypothetical protein
LKTKHSNAKTIVCGKAEITNGIITNDRLLLKENSKEFKEMIIK